MYTVGQDNTTETARSIANVSFNPSAKPEVDEIKMLFARLVTILEPVQAARGAGGRLASIAITQFEGAAMFAVKAVTR
jgi:hypothetical protein